MEQLNYFFRRFEAEAAVTIIPEPVIDGQLQGITDSQPLNPLPADVRRSFRNINVQKVAGPGGVPGRALRDCATELAEVFANIFNVSLQQCSVPTCLKSSIIVPIPKQTGVLSFNDYSGSNSCSHEVFWEIGAKAHIKAGLPSTLDSCQYTYRNNRSTDDAIPLLSIRYCTFWNNREHMPGCCLWTIVLLLILFYIASCFWKCLPWA